MSTKDVDFKIVDLILSSGTLSKESRNDPVFHECIHELSALPMYRLSSEPTYLRDCHRRIIEENYKLAYDNYSTFIQTADCTKQIFTDFELVEKQNELLLQSIPNFVGSCNSFVEKCRKSIAMANMNSLTLKNHNQILEILEMPQLLEACIRNNYLDEALELIAHSRKLERRHYNVDIIVNVAYESRLAAQKLLDQLFQQLGANLQLPACLKIVGYLRRMDCLPDSLLRMKFLQCRDNYLKNLLVSLPTSDPFFHATKHMELTRINLFDIATQYRAVFNDEDIYLTNSDNDQFQQGMLFSSWLVMRLRSFMTSFGRDLDLIVQNSIDYKHTVDASQSMKTSSQSIGSKLHSLLGQSMYFGLSLSRIGSDFRGLLMPLFYQSITRYVQLRLDEIRDPFADCICSYKWTLQPPSDIEDLKLDACSLAACVRATDELVRNQKSDEVAAPHQLMNHPLLAMLMNQLVSIIEDIRLCCPRVLRVRICHTFATTLDQISACLAHYYQDETPNLSPRERLSFQSMALAFLSCLLPHINLCLVALFASSDQNSSVTSSLTNRRSYPLDIAKIASDHFVEILPDSFYASDVSNIAVEDAVDDDDNEGIHAVTASAVSNVDNGELVRADTVDDANGVTEITDSVVGGAVDNDILTEMTNAVDDGDGVTISPDAVTNHAAETRRVLVSTDDGNDNEIMDTHTMGVEDTGGATVPLDTDKQSTNKSFVDYDLRPRIDNGDNICAKSIDVDCEDRMEDGDEVNNRQ